jgi:effector-binding domain-containing protein
MNYEIAVQTVAAQPAAVVRARLAWNKLGGNLIPLLDKVYVAVRTGSVVQTGQNIFIYREPTRESVAVEIGVEVSQTFEPVGEVVYTETPAGGVAMAEHIGPYAGLGKAHEAVIAWCDQHGYQRTGVFWELYGDWEEDPAKLSTKVYYELRSL